MAGHLRALALLLALAPGTAAAEPQHYSADYVVSLYGLTVARSRFTSTVDGNAFTIRGSIATAGLARIIDNTRGTTSVSGHFAGNRARPDAFLISYTSGKKKKKTAIDFANDAVSRTENIPPPKKRGDKWVPLAEGDLVAVTDPLSLTLLKAGTPREVCSHTLKYYDGELRADIPLSYIAIAPMTIPGYSGDAVVCSARFVPVAGYRKGNSTIEYLKNESKMTIAFAPMGATGVYVPIQASIGTRIGTILVTASRFAEGQ